MGKAEGVAVDGYQYRDCDFRFVGENWGVVGT